MISLPTVAQSGNLTFCALNSPKEEETRPSLNRPGDSTFIKTKEEMLEHRHRPLHSQYDGTLQVGAK